MTEADRKGEPEIFSILPGAHEWVSFEDPDEDRTWLVDVTFLESSWSCIFGRGCQGVLTGPAPEMEQGCCSYGAHFTGPEDAARVEAASWTLTDEEWQFRSTARKRGGALRRGSGPITTRLVDGACIFLNRPDHPGGAGCALHVAALNRGALPLALKPDVCWQLPLRREDIVAPDDHVTTSIGEWRREHWGKGGAEFAWWCTEAPEAFGRGKPVYQSMSDELHALMGTNALALVTRYLEARNAAPSPQPVRLPHPATRQSVQ